MLVFNASPIETAPPNPIPLTVPSIIQSHLHSRNKLIQNNKRLNSLQSSITTEINSVQCRVILQCKTQIESSFVANLIACSKHKNEFISSVVLFFHALLLHKFSLVKVGWFSNTSLNTLVPSTPSLFSAIKNTFVFLYKTKKQSFHH